jgi:cell division septum initiation protein DivIVA
MEILGLLDTLESMILDGTKIPFSKRVIINEEKILSVIDKMRLVIQGGEGLAKEAIVSKAGGRLMSKAGGEPDDAGVEISRELLDVKSPEEAKAVEILQQAYQMAKEIREGSDRYADEVLSNLEATSTRLLRTIKAGRERLTKNVEKK